VLLLGYEGIAQSKIVSDSNNHSSVKFAPLQQGHPISLPGENTANNGVTFSKLNAGIPVQPVNLNNASQTNNKVTTSKINTSTPIQPVNASNNLPVPLQKKDSATGVNKK
jgi:hypothetical protein